MFSVAIIIIQWLQNISEACSEESKSTIPRIPGKESAHIPGWKKLVEPVRSKAFFWQHIWSEFAQPKTGILADIMRNARASYHYAICAARRNEQRIVKKINVFDAIVNNRNRDF
jgi:hypothetical protein